MWRSLQNVSSSSWQYQSHDRWTGSQQHHGGWQWNEVFTLAEQDSDEHEEEDDALKWTSAGWTSSKQYKSDWQWNEPCTSFEQDSVEHGAPMYTDRDSCWKWHSQAWANSNQDDSNDSMNQSTETLRRTVCRQQGQICEMRELVGECVTEIKLLRRKIHDVLHAYQRCAEQHITDDSRAGSSNDQVEPDATAASVTTAIVPYTRSGTTLDEGCCRAHDQFKDGIADAQTKQNRGHGTTEPDVHHWMDHLHSALFHYDSRYWNAIRDNLIAQWRHLKVEACRTSANRYYYVECTRCKCFIFGKYDKYHDGAGSVEKNKLLQLLGAEVPDSNENAKLCHVLAKASIVSILPR